MTATTATPTITDVFDLPRAQDIRALGFVIKLGDVDARSGGADEQRVAKLIDDYVITPSVEAELPRILDDIKQVYDRGEEYGRFIHGSFGSGKSHFMTLLSMLLEHVGPAWDKFRPLLARHRAAQKAEGRAPVGRNLVDHETWIPQANLLVVRIHMLSVRGRTTGLDRAVYDAFNAALERRGKPSFEFLHVDAIFAEIRREADNYGDLVWKHLQTAGIVGSAEEFEAVAKGSPRGRERLARAWLAHKGRDPAQSGIDPRWSEGLRRMGEHARAQGFGGIVLMIDELLLWLAEKSGQEFVREINDLDVIVDHNTGQRPLPIFVFAALQRNVKEFFPDLADESKIYEHIDHHLKRFEITKLEDTGLRHIVKGRVLRPTDAAMVQRAVDSLAEAHKRVLPALLADADLDYLRDVYPFHPALIEMLVDVTSLMQRERSALRLLYELLVIHYPNLPLGQFLPVGSAFAAIFPRSGVEASKKVELMQDIHHQYYTRLVPAMQAMAEDDARELDPERLRALDQLVKTVLLAEVSPKLKQNGLTIERLVQLNAVDVEGETYRSRVRVAETDLLALSQAVPDLQVAGRGKTALVRYVLGRVSLGEILRRARSKVDNAQQRFRVFWPALKQALSIAGHKGFEDGGPNRGDWDLKDWRRTRRRGALVLGNVREMTYEDFVPPAGTFQVLIDYPWDKPGHTVDEDRLKATKVRKTRGSMYTACWLPRHLSPTELAVLTDLAALQYLLSDPGQEDLLDTLGPQDRTKVLDQARIRLKTSQGQLDDLLREVYIRHGEFLALISDVDKSRPHETLADNLRHIATVLMDRRYPQHPAFLAEPRAADLTLLLSWMVAAGETDVSVGYDEATGKVLRNLGQPLELVNLGQSKASLRLDSRYIKDVLQRTDKDSLSWAPVAEHLRESYGLQSRVVNLFLCFLCQRNHRALDELTGEPIEVDIGISPSARVRLERGALVGGAQWHRLRALGHQLLAVPRPLAPRSLQGQDRFAVALKDRGRDKRAALQVLHQRLVALGVGDTERSEDAQTGEHSQASERLTELALANARLAALAKATTDSFSVLNELLDAWPDDASDPLRAVVEQVEAVRDSVGAINEHARKNLQAGAHHPQVGGDVQDHLAALDSRLAAAQAAQPLTGDWVQRWNEKAQALVRRLIEQPSPHVGPTHSPVVNTVAPLRIGDSKSGQEPAAAPVTSPLSATLHAANVQTSTLHTATIDPGDAQAVDTFLRAVRRALQTLNAGSRITLAVVRTGASTGASTEAGATAQTEESR
ncbi:MAG: DUF6079 family protein [Proteobacteria bacterium]|nr:DUF6079 family protein [Pseudomonadota bacterium]